MDPWTRVGTELGHWDAHVSAVSRNPNTLDIFFANTKGQIMTEFAVTSARDPAGRGRVLAPLRLADPEVVALLRAGDVVDILAADAQAEQAYVAGRGVRVVTVPQPSDTTRGADPAGALVLVGVDQDTARVLARAAVAATLTVIWRS